jgi:hypothetical protein
LGIKCADGGLATKYPVLTTDPEIAARLITVPGGSGTLSMSVSAYSPISKRSAGSRSAKPVKTMLFALPFCRGKLQLPNNNEIASGIRRALPAGGRIHEDFEEGRI